jgi:NAD(P)-dependent dehydrogenase (short-subunit alcohol dehydrogenase family)
MRVLGLSVQPNSTWRHAQPQDIATIAAFLASADAGWVNGQLIYAAGGPDSLIFLLCGLHVWLLRPTFIP